MGSKRRSAWITLLPQGQAETVDALQSMLAKTQRDLLSNFRKVIREQQPDVTETLCWGMPLYRLAGNLAYIDFGSQTVDFGFFYGAELTGNGSNWHGEGERLRYMRWDHSEAIDWSEVGYMLQQAARRNRKNHRENQ